MVPMMLSQGGRAEPGCGGEGESEADHAAAPSIGRTVTTRIMPACMW